MDQNPMARLEMAVVKPGRRPFYVARWTDPQTGKRREKSTGEKLKRPALAWAANLAAQIVGGTPAHETAWADFVARYKATRLANKSPATAAQFHTAERDFWRVIRPKSPGAVTSETIERYKATLRAEGTPAGTIAQRMGHLRTAFSWAADPTVAIIGQKPRFQLPPYEARGRALTREEFDRMLAATAEVVGEKNGKSWRRFLWGLWLSGMRLGEALAFSWDDPNTHHVLRLEGKRPVALFKPTQKNRKEQVCPLPGDFARFLLGVPLEQRTGPVFAPRLSRGPTYNGKTVSKRVSAIGEAAGVIVNAAGESASAHDLRRSFGYRWAMSGVSPGLLKALMRHASITTTLKFYVVAEAERLAREAWDGPESGALGGASNSRENSRPKRKRPPAPNPRPGGSLHSKRSGGHGT